MFHDVKEGIASFQNAERSCRCFTISGYQKLGLIARVYLPKKVHFRGQKSTLSSHISLTKQENFPTNIFWQGAWTAGEEWFATPRQDLLLFSSRRKGFILNRFSHTYSFKRSPSIKGKLTIQTHAVIGHNFHLLMVFQTCYLEERDLATRLTDRTLSCISSNKPKLCMSQHNLQ